MPNYTKWSAEVMLFIFWVDIMDLFALFGWTTVGRWSKYFLHFNQTGKKVPFLWFMATTVRSEILALWSFLSIPSVGSLYNLSVSRSSNCISNISQSEGDASRSTSLQSSVEFCDKCAFKKCSGSSGMVSSHAWKMYLVSPRILPDK